MTAPPIRERVAAMMERLHDDTTALFAGLDGGRFREDRWDRPGGGGGVARVLSGGRTFEKAGINRSAVSGLLPPGAAQRLGARGVTPEDAQFYATGVSLVAHPQSPMVPTVHLNVRYFELTDPAGRTLDVWLGGGTDLTPTYPFPEDAVHFHRALKLICDRHHPSFYPRFKTWCDHYFVNTHRGDERRGVGGVFFDNLRDGESGLDLERLTAFVLDVGQALSAAYQPLVERRRGLPYGERERHFQLVAPRPLRRIQPGARSGHRVRPADERADRERADEPAAPRGMGVRAGLRARIVRGGADEDAGAAGLGGGGGQRAGADSGAGSGSPGSK